MRRTWSPTELFLPLEQPNTDSLFDEVEAKMETEAHADAEESQRCRVESAAHVPGARNGDS